MSPVGVIQRSMFLSTYASIAVSRFSSATRSMAFSTTPCV
jgi:hypothetical protein